MPIRGLRIDNKTQHKRTQQQAQAIIEVAIEISYKKARQSGQSVVRIQPALYEDALRAKRTIVVEYPTSNSCCIRQVINSGTQKLWNNKEFNCN